MTARYNYSDNTLKEISQMEEPEMGKYWFMFKYDEDVQKYDAHIASLRTLPCHDSCRGLLKEGDVLEERKDYEVRPVCNYTGSFDNANCLTQPSCDQCTMTAFPLVPVKSEDDPYEELLTMIARSSWDRNEIIAEAKKQFIVTKR